MNLFDAPNYANATFPQPRVFQERAHELLRQGRRAGHKNQLMTAPTGAGKTYLGLRMLSEGMAKAKSTDAVKVAHAMSGLKFQGTVGEVEMRKTDHQLQQPLYMTVWDKASAKYPYSPENTGMTLAPVKEYPNYVSSTPTSCQMKRPT